MPTSLGHIAVFIDVENLNRLQSLDFGVLQDFLRREGRLTVCRAYADWRQVPDVRDTLVRAGLELVDMAALNGHGKNATDIRIAVDAIELSHTQPQVASYVIVSGDSDFVPLIVKLRSYQKLVTLVAESKNTARAAKSYCDRLIDFADIPGFQRPPPAAVRVDRVEREPTPRPQPTASGRGGGAPTVPSSAADDAKLKEMLVRAVARIQQRVGAATIGAARTEVNQSEIYRDAVNSERHRRLILSCLAEGSLKVRLNDRQQPLLFRSQRAEIEATTRDYDARCVAAYRLLQRVILVHHCRLPPSAPPAIGALKPRMQRLDGDFHEAKLGFGKFGEFVDAAHRSKYVQFIDDSDLVTLNNSPEQTAREWVQWRLAQTGPRDPWAMLHVALAVDGLHLQRPEVHAAVLRSTYDQLAAAPSGKSRSQMSADLSRDFFGAATIGDSRQVLAEMAHALLQLGMLAALSNGQLTLPSNTDGFEDWKQTFDQRMVGAMDKLDAQLDAEDWNTLQVDLERVRADAPSSRLDSRPVTEPQPYRQRTLLFLEPQPKE